MKRRRRLKKDIIAKFNNSSPCKKCFIQACCSKYCEEFKDYYETLKDFVANELDNAGFSPIEFTKIHSEIVYEIIGSDQDTFRKYNQCRVFFKK